MDEGEIKIVRQQLLDHAEEDYRAFSQRLLPKGTKLLGVRMPFLHGVSGEIVRMDWRSYLAEAPLEYMEDKLLYGMIIGKAECSAAERLDYAAKFIPQIDNWSVCDTFCAGLKFTKKEPVCVWDFLQPYLISEREYEVRFAVVMLLDYFILPAYTEAVLQALDQVRHPGYFVHMAIAWAISVCYIKEPEKTGRYLLHNHLADATYNQALQKIIESRRAAPEVKACMRRMKRR